MTGTSAVLRGGAEACGLGRRHSADDLVVVAAGERGFEHRRIGGDHGLARRRTAARAPPRSSAATPETRQSLARSPARPSETSIAAEACVRTASASAVARLRQQIARQQMLALRVASVSSPRPCAARGRARHRRCVPVTKTRSPGLAPARRTIVPARHAAEHGDRDRDRPGRAVGVAAEQRAAISVGVARASLARNAASQSLADLLRQRQRQQKAERLRALGGEIGQIHPQRLARDRRPASSGKEMHAADRWRRS